MPLCAAPSDDAFPAFADIGLAKLERDAKAYAQDLAALAPARVAHSRCRPAFDVQGLAPGFYFVRYSSTAG